MWIDDSGERDFVVERDVFHRLLVHHRECAGKPKTDGTAAGVGFAAELVFAAAEHFAFRQQFRVTFHSYDRFILWHSIPTSSDCFPIIQYQSVPQIHDALMMARVACRQRQIMTQGRRRNHHVPMTYRLPRALQIGENVTGNIGSFNVKRQNFLVLQILTQGLNRVTPPHLMQSIDDFHDRYRRQRTLLIRGKIIGGLSTHLRIFALVDFLINIGIQQRFIQIRVLR